MNPVYVVSAGPEPMRPQQKHRRVFPHPRLIATEKAERILAELEAGRGLLPTPEGKAWHGDGDGAYRVGKGRRVSRTKLEKGIIDRLTQDLTSKHFVAALTKEARRISAPTLDTEVATLRAEVKKPYRHDQPVYRSSRPMRDTKAVSGAHCRCRKTARQGS
jgi:hypothetical protein